MYTGNRSKEDIIRYINGGYQEDSFSPLPTTAYIPFFSYIGIIFFNIHVKFIYIIDYITIYIHNITIINSFSQFYQIKI